MMMMFHCFVVNNTSNSHLYKRKDNFYKYTSPDEPLMEGCFMFRFIYSTLRLLLKRKTQTI